LGSTPMARKSKNKSPAIERDPNPFMRVSGPFADDILPPVEKRYLDLADIALGNRASEPPRPKRREQVRAASASTQL
jgi:hypothetical protein